LRDELDWSASDSLIAPSSPISFSVLSENQTKEVRLLLLRSRLKYGSDEFDLSASDNLIAPSLPISLSVLRENEMKQQVDDTL
jgi:hypothetical protein